METIDFCASFFRSIPISIPEAVMFICFGFSWPVSVFKALRTKRVTGKSPLFMVLIIIGYTSGIAHKIIFSRDILIVLYLFNLLMIVADLCLYLRYHVSEQDKVTPSRNWGLSGYLLPSGGISGTDHSQARLHPRPLLIALSNRFSF